MTTLEAAAKAAWDETEPKFPYDELSTAAKNRIISEHKVFLRHLAANPSDGMVEAANTVLQYPHLKATTSSMISAALMAAVEEK